MARAIGLGYPGGPKIEKVAHEGNPHAVEFPRPKIADGEYDFSFSGLKSAVLNHLNSCKMKGIEIVQADIAASFQKAVIDVLVGNAMHAIENIRLINLQLQVEWHPMGHCVQQWKKNAVKEMWHFIIHLQYCALTMQL